MMNSVIEEIKNRLDVVEVIGSYIKLQKAGASYRAVCPFHAEKTPSFFVSPARQIWHCFGCSLGGGIFDFVMKIEGVEFGDALRILALKAGVELKKQDPAFQTERQRLYEICELAASFFEKQLESKIGEEVKKYLLKRGISETSVKDWRVGYAPESWQALSDFLAQKGYKADEIIKAGLAIAKDNAASSKTNHYDRFRNRIMFPVFDIGGQIVGFGGRIFEIEGGSVKAKTGEAKYINTPATLLYDKSRVLYGLDKAKVEIRKKDAFILVEGYTDVIMSHQAGLKNAVAVSGTALTPYHLNILKRYSQNLIAAFDMDTGGDEATKRGIELALQRDFKIKVAVMPEGKDPADVISENPENWRKIIGGAREIIDFYLETSAIKYDGKTIEGKRRISKAILPWLKRINNKIELSHWAQKLAKILAVKEEVIFEELKKIKVEAAESESAEAAFAAGKAAMAPAPAPRKQMLEERLLSLIIKNPQVLEAIEEKDYDFFSSRTVKIFSYFKKKTFSSGGASEEIKVKFASFEKEVEPDISEFLNLLFVKSESEEEPADQKKDFYKEETENCLAEIKKIEGRERLNKISEEIKKSEEEKDFQRAESLFQEYMKLSQEFNI